MARMYEASKEDVRRERERPEEDKVPGWKRFKGGFRRSLSGSDGGLRCAGTRQTGTLPLAHETQPAGAHSHYRRRRWKPAARNRFPGV